MRMRWFRRTLALALMVSTVAPAMVRAQETCDDPMRALRDARRSYERMQTSETIRLLEACRELGVFDDDPAFDEDQKREALRQRQEALRLLALSYFVRNEPVAADTTVRYLMKWVAPNFRANPNEDPIFFQDLVNKYRPRWYKKTWVRVTVLGGVAVIGGVLGIVLSDKDPPPLRDPPPQWGGGGGG